MYREKQPHQGFNLIKEIARNMSKNKGGENLFVVTSNVDGHFEKAGFSDEQVYECHGSIHHLQCVSCDSITPNHFQPEVDYEQMSCRNMPKCQQCN
jgi:NAD-dependent SIR2 family protein deacetylase